MKTQIIHLEQNDDVVSVRDKMSWAKTKRILLVWPARQRLLTRDLDLLLLQRHAANLGAQLGLVTRIPNVREVASELGIACFASVSQAQGSHWRRRTLHQKPKRRTARPDLRTLRAEVHPPLLDWLAHPVTRLTFFTLGVLAVIAVLLLFLPSTEISLNPQLRNQELTLQVNASPGITTVNMAGSLPARKLTIVVEDSQSTPATGQTTLPDKPAEGTARFRNLTTSVIGIPVGTVIRTLAEPPIKFATTRDAVLAAGLDKTIDIPIRAIEPGLTRNLAADSLNAIEGELGTEIAVTNPNPTSGGAERVVSMPSAADRTHLRSVLLAQMRLQAFAQLSEQPSEGDLFFPNSLVLEKILEETYQPLEGQPGETLTLTLQAEFTIQYAQASDIRSLAAAALDAVNLKDWRPVTSTLKIAIAGDPVSNGNGTTRFTIQATRLLIPNISDNSVKRSVLGLSVDEARVRLQSMFPLASPPRFKLTPAWWPWLPFLQFRIMIKE